MQRRAQPLGPDLLLGEVALSRQERDYIDLVPWPTGDM